MRVAVTGGAGFIGSNLVPALVAQDHEVLVLDDLSTGCAERVPEGARLEVTSILSPVLPAIFADFRPDAVVHLAAQTSVQKSIVDPLFDSQTNVDGTIAVARASTSAGVAKMILASTAAVYGEPSEIPLFETSGTHPTNPYGTSKLAAEVALMGEAEKAGSEFFVLRLSNVYGPGQDASGEGGVVAVFCQRALASEPLVVFGDGHQTRDFVFVGDVVDALARALAVGDSPTALGSRVLNVSTGAETQVLDVARLVSEAAATTLEIRHEPRPRGDVHRSALEPSLARQVLGWRAETPLEEGIAVTVSWFRGE